MTLLRKLIGDAPLKAMQDDPVKFVRAFDRDPWDYQANILRQVLARQEDGKFRHWVAIVSTPRQNGKSTISAWAALWRLYCDPDNQEIVSVALDRPSAGIILGDAKRIIQKSEILFGLLDDEGQKRGITKSEIRLRDGRSWVIKSADAVYSRGLRPSLVCYDELGWTSDDGDLYQVLSTAQAAQLNPLIVVTSTVGPVKAGPLWELFQAAEAGDSDVLLIYKTENLSPLVTEKFLESQRAKLPAHVYAREHQNLWGEGTGAFCTNDDWKKATERGNPLRDYDPGPCYAFIDLGWVHNEAVLAVSKRHEGKIDILALETWQGSQSKPVEFVMIEERLRKMAENLNIRKVEIESPQGVHLAQRLNFKGVECNVCHPTVKSNRECWGALYTALKSGTVRLPKDTKLRRQLLTLTIKETTSGWKVVDIPSIHNDRAMACAGAIQLARKTGSLPQAFLLMSEEGENLNYYNRGWSSWQMGGRVRKRDDRRKSAWQ